MATDTPKPAIRNEQERPAAVRNRPASFGGARLKLEVFGTIPGYHLYWENDENAAIEQLLSEGFDFVTAEEVGMTSKTTRIVADKDVDGRFSKYVGTRADGTGPLRAFLLKCPDELWEDRQAMRGEQDDLRDQAIREGHIGNVDSSYTPHGYKSSVKTI